MAFKVSNEARAGILAIIAIALFFVGFNYLKGKGILSSDKSVYATYDDVTGLTASSFVQLKGVTIGNVKSITMSKKYPGKVLVEMNINGDVELPIDSKAGIASADMIGMGGNIVSVVPGVSTEKIKDGDYLEIYTKVGLMGEIGKSAGHLTENADNAISTINSTVGNINSLIDAETKNNLQQSIKGLNASVANFKSLSDELNAQRAKITETMNSLSSFAKNLNNNNQSINKIMNNAETTTQKLSKLEIQSTVDNLKNTLGDLNKTIAKMNSSEGTLGMLMNDKKAYDNLQKSLASMDDLLADLKANPKRYVSFSLIGRKEKKDEPIVAPNEK